MFKNSLFYTIRNSFWYLPAFYSGISIVLAYLSVVVDEWIDRTDLHALLPRFLVTDRETTQIILSALATSILTMTAITFSSIMVLFSTYLSQYSPRTLNNFISDTVTRRVLGIFIGSFLYFVLVMLWMNISEQTTFFIIPSLSVALSGVCLAFFVYFIHHVSSWIQVNNLIQDITDNCLLILKSKRDRFSVLNTSVTSPWASWENEEHRLDAHLSVASETPGYVQFIDIEGLVERAQQDDLLFEMEKSLGDYVDQGTVLFKYWSLGNRGPNLPDYLTYIRIGKQRTTEQDIEFGIQKLTEIALRAISPCINDPQTAIHCIQRLGKILSRLTNQPLEEPMIFDTDNNLRLILKRTTFSHLLYKTFYQIRFYGRQDVSVLAAIFEALTLIAEKSDTETKSIVWQFMKAVCSGIDRSAMIDMDFHYLNEKIDQVARHTGHLKEKYHL